MISYLTLAFPLLARLLVSCVAVRQTDLLDLSWQDALRCKCRKVKSVAECPDMDKDVPGSYAPSFPHYYHEVAGNQVCCRITSTELQQKLLHGWKWTQSKDLTLCMQEKRPMPEDGCCLFEEVQSFRLRYGRKFSKAFGKDEASVKLEDYSEKTRLTFQPRELGNQRDVDSKLISPQEVMAVLGKFVNVNANVSCDAFETAAQCPFRVPGCCCSPSVLGLGGETCVAVSGAPKNPLVRKLKPMMDSAAMCSGIVDYVAEDPTKFAPKEMRLAPTGEPKVELRHVLIGWEKQIKDSLCLKSETKPVAVPNFDIHGKPTPPCHGEELEWCTLRNFTLACPSGHFLYDRIPGSPMGDRCPDGFKTNRTAQAYAEDYDQRCRCEATVDSRGRIRYPLRPGYSIEDSRPVIKPDGLDD